MKGSWWRWLQTSRHDTLGSLRPCMRKCGVWSVTSSSSQQVSLLWLQNRQPISSRGNEPEPSPITRMFLKEIFSSKLKLGEELKKTSGKNTEKIALSYWMSQSPWRGPSVLPTRLMLMFADPPVLSSTSFQEPMNAEAEGWSLIHTDNERNS